MKKKQRINIKKIVIITFILVGVAFFYNFSQTLRIFDNPSLIYPKSVSITENTNEYVMYNIPFETYFKSGGCENFGNIDISFETTPYTRYRDMREYEGEEVTIPALSFNKINNLQLNKEFSGELTDINANVIYGPCTDYTRNLKPLGKVKVLCRVSENNINKQDIRCSLNGRIVGQVTGSPIASATGGRWNGERLEIGAEVDSNMQLVTLSGGTVKIKIYKEGYPSNIIQGWVGVAGKPNLEGVLIEWKGKTATTSSTGSYAIKEAELGSGVLRFLKQGYQTLEKQIDHQMGIETITVNLVEIPVKTLPPVEILPAVEPQYSVITIIIALIGFLLLLIFFYIKTKERKR